MAGRYLAPVATLPGCQPFDPPLEMFAARTPFRARRAVELVAVVADSDSDFRHVERRAFEPAGDDGENPVDSFRCPGAVAPRRVRLRFEWIHPFALRAGPFAVNQIERAVEFAHSAVIVSVVVASEHNNPPLLTSVINVLFAAPH